MKKSVITALVFLLFLGMFGGVNAEPCSLTVTKINQDPYPAVPNSFVELVFQVSGVKNPECKHVEFEVVEAFPFNVEGENLKSIKGGTFVQNFNSEWMVPYRIFVNENAVDGIEELEVKYNFAGEEDFLSKKFEVKIEDSQTDFEIHVKNYDYELKEITLEILNIGEVDVEAVVLEIPKQENVDVKGSNRIIVGDMDASEYTTATFEATPTDGEIQINMLYTDAIDIRRPISKTVNYDSSYFTGRVTDQVESKSSTYIATGVVVVVVLWFIFQKRKKKKEKLLKKKGMAKL